MFWLLKIDLDGVYDVSLRVGSQREACATTGLPPTITVEFYVPRLRAVEGRPWCVPLVTGVRSRESEWVDYTVQARCGNLSGKRAHT